MSDEITPEDIAGLGAILAPPVPIHEIGPGGYWTGESVEIAAEGGCPQGWTREPLPEFSEDEFAVFTAPSWTVATEPFAPPVQPIAELAAARLARLADYRWQREVAGTVFNGAPIATDRESQGKVTGAYALAKDDPDYVVPNWKVAPGQFITLDAAAIVLIAKAVSGYVVSCFSREAALSGEILAALAAQDRAAIEAIDITTGWP